MSVEGVLLEWTRALGWTLIHTLWQGAAVAVAWAVFRALTRGRDVRLRYAGGLVALGLLLALPAATLWRLAPGGTAALPSAVHDAMLPAPGGLAASIDAWLPLVVLAWLAGVLLAALREGWRWHAVRALLLGSATALPDWTDRAARIAQRLRVSRPVRVVSSTLALTPSLVGWIAPVIVLPASTLVALSPRQLEMVIAHELAHVRRADYLVNLLQVAVETLLFHHPAVHWISRDVRELREACCDDLVLRSGVDPLHYADTLTCLEELRGITHAPALAATGGSLLLRVRRIVGAGTDAPVRLDGQLVVLCAGLLALVLGLTSHRELPAESPVAAATPSAVLARSAVAAVEAVAVPAVVTPAAPRAIPAPAAAAPAVTARRTAPAPAPAPTAPAPLDVALERATFAVDVAPMAPPVEAPVVDDLRLVRSRVRPVLLIVNDPPIDCVRALGSRLCRALPKPMDDTVLAEQARAELASGRESLRRATTHIRQAEVLGGQ